MPGVALFGRALTALIVVVMPSLPIARVPPPAAARVAAPAAFERRPAASERRPPLSYEPPVDAPIIDHFRPPACRWCPGNRGIDYATAPGSAVRASAGGVVTFAGAIGGDWYVTVLHSDGLRTSYAYLTSIAVHAGQTVTAGTIVGITGATLHFGVRRGSVYLDPELLLAGGRLRPRLVPTGGGPGRARTGAGTARGTEPAVEGRRWSATMDDRPGTDGPPPS